MLLLALKFTIEVGEYHLAYSQEQQKFVTIALGLNWKYHPTLIVIW